MKETTLFISINVLVTICNFLGVPNNAFSIEITLSSGYIIKIKRKKPIFSETNKYNEEMKLLQILLTMHNIEIKMTLMWMKRLHRKSS